MLLDIWLLAQHRASRGRRRILQSASTLKLFHWVAYCICFLQHSQHNRVWCDGWTYV